MNIISKTILRALYTNNVVQLLANKLAALKFTPDLDALDETK